jgi:hypothetical protein
MHVETGDRLMVTERRHDSGYVCRVLSAWGPEGMPPYVVLRYDTGREELLVPEPDVTIGVLATASV